MKERPLAFVCLVALIVGFLLVEWGGGRFVKELHPSMTTKLFEDGEAVVVTGRIYRKEMRSKYQVIYLKHNSIHSNIKSKNEPISKKTKERNIQIYVEKHIKNVGSIGNTIQIEGMLSFFETARNPGNFDQKFYYQKQDIHTCVFAKSTQLLDGETNFVAELLSEYRTRWKQKLYEVAGEEKGAILSAMLLGEKSDMDEEIKELYRVTGIGHILAISGLHLSFIGTGVYRSARRIGGSYVVAGIIGVLFLSAYIMMIGWSVSALRAVVMFVLRVGADMSGRIYDTPTAVAVSAVSVIWWRPLSYYDSGFYLSFGAILGATIVFATFRERKKGKKKERKQVWTYMIEGILVGVCIQFVTLPVVLFSYYEFPTYSVVLNLLIIPLMSVLLITGIVGSIISILSPTLGQICISISKGILEVYEGVCRWSEELPFSRIVCGQPSRWQVLLFYGCFLLLLVCWKKRKKWKKAATVAFALTAIILCTGHRMQGQGKLIVTAIDVGQGDSIYLKETGGKTYLIDGGSSDVTSVGKYRIEPYLKQQGTGVLDYVVLTHGDADHSNGVVEMIRRGKRGIQIRNVILPVQEVWDEPLKELAEEAYRQGIKVHTIGKGQQLIGQELVIECLYPGDTDKGKSGNEASLVLSATFQQFSILLTGDLEGNGEQVVTEEIKGLQTATLLKVAHHGSKNSTSNSFLHAIEPRTAIVSSGQNNPYGHPHKEIVQRLEEHNVAIYNTAERGAILIETNGESMNIKTQL